MTSSGACGNRAPSIYTHSHTLRVVTIGSASEIKKLDGNIVEKAASKQGRVAALVKLKEEPFA
jgi:hypothetical protein